jgi:site-specific recombinase XerD
MNQLAPVTASRTPALVSASGERAQTRFLEFFAARIRNKHTRRAYAQATLEFLACCERAGVASIADVKPLHVATYIEHLSQARSALTAQAAPGRVATRSIGW